MKLYEKAALDHATNNGVPHTLRDEPAWMYSERDFIAGVRWAIEQLRSEDARICLHDHCCDDAPPMWRAPDLVADWLEREEDA